MASAVRACTRGLARSRSRSIAAEHAAHGGPPDADMSTVWRRTRIPGLPCGLIKFDLSSRDRYLSAQRYAADDTEKMAAGAWDEGTPAC